MTPPLFKICRLFFLFLPILISAQKIGHISVEGNKEFSASEIIRWSELRSGQIYTDSLMQVSEKKMKLNLSEYGYYNSGIHFKTESSENDTTEVDLSINVNEFTPTFVENIFYEAADTSVVQILKQNFEFLVGVIFSKYEFESVVNNVLDHFENIGFPFASIKINSFYFFSDSLNENHFVDIYLQFSKSESSLINEIKISGNTKTKDYVIKRNMRIFEGDVYSQKKLSDVPKLLNRLRFFEPVAAPTYYFDNDGKGVLEITVAEKETNAFDGIIGYVPSRSKGESGFFTGFVNISLHNIFGTERAAAFRWEKLERESQELEIKYLEPWLFGYPVNVQASLFQRKQDSTYVQRRVEGDIQLLITEDISASFLIGTESTIPTDPDERGFTVFNSTSLITGANLKFDTRDDVYSPTGGLLFINAYKFSQKKINGPAQFITSATKTKSELQRFELDLTAYYEIFNRQVIAAGVHAREMKGNNFEISDLYKLGGTNTLRGYREDQFLGNRTFWSNLEYRYLLTRRSFAFIFFDTGYYLRNADAENKIERISSFTYGYGLGLSLETGLGIMGVSFALGEGDSFGDGKIHFGLLNEF